MYQNEIKKKLWNEQNRLKRNEQQEIYSFNHLILRFKIKSLNFMINP